jgi:hypothetical protein
MNITIHIIKCNPLPDRKYQLVGAVITEDCFGTWVATTDDEFKIMNDEDLRVLVTRSSGIFLEHNKEIRDKIKRQVFLYRLQGILS